MNHRKIKHPSNRTCRYFLKDECVHGLDCWYSHSEPMDVDSGSNQNVSSPRGIKCPFCDQTFEDWNGLRYHKKKAHSSNVTCHRFLEGRCDKSEQQCEYKHDKKMKQNEKQEEIIKESGFRFPPVDPFPPDQAQLIMKTLEMVLQKMDVMERFFQQTQQ